MQGSVGHVKTEFDTRCGAPVAMDLIAAVEAGWRAHALLESRAGLQAHSSLYKSSERQSGLGVVANWRIVIAKWTTS